ncbi:MAG TPA: thiamine diphosphokinase [Methylomirabilota bacterium]|nr:thiamine diphosphokinase [Methylomirabilota bacterium]
MKAVVVAHGEVLARDRDALAGAALVVAADGGSLTLDRWGVVPDLLVGDLDSVSSEKAAELGRRGARIIPYPPQKDQSDLELAMRHALESGADDIVILGAFGGRLDHALANVLLLADPAYRGVGIRAIQGESQIRAAYGPSEMALRGPAGSLVTLLPVRADANGVRSRGLLYPLNRETLHFGRSRGLSNIVTSLPASVSLESGVLLVIENARVEE